MTPKLRRLLPFLLLGVPSCCPTAPAPMGKTGQRVVLVNGFSETGSIFNMLQKRLEKHGIEVYAPLLKHPDGRGGIENLARHLKRDIDQRFGPEVPISIVSFSMGGLVSREYLQNQGGAARCENLITISSPHNGTLAAWTYPTQGVREMRPGSPFLKHLRETEGHLGKMTLVSYRTRLDLVILPPRSSVWDRAENVEYPVALHPMMLTSQRVVNDIEKRLVKEP
jgi:triacylglycerol lipase